MEQFLEAIKLISTLASLLIVARVVSSVGIFIPSHLIVVIVMATAEFKFRALVVSVSVLA